jgi:hypothetical protein
MRSCRPLVAAIPLSALIFLAATPGGAASKSDCDLVASPSGSASAAGTVEDPLAGAHELVDALKPGQVGCFAAGTYRFRRLTISRPRVELTSVPGGRAMLRGRLAIARGADRVTISDLDLDGSSGDTNDPSPVVNANRAVFDQVDVTNDHTGICFLLGSPVWGRANHTVIKRSRIHDCGRLPAQNNDHGIYLSAASHTVIRHNWIYRNADRGIQLYPDAQYTRVVGNVLYGNGEGIIFSGNQKVAANHNLVALNVIADSRIRSNVESYYEPGGPIGRRNIVRFNCVRGGGSDYYAGPDNTGIQQGHVGFRAAYNLNAIPRFVDPANDDFHLTPDSPCAHLGGKVSLRTPRLEGRRMRLRGRLPGPPVRKVKVQFKRRGSWKTLTRKRVPDAAFKMKVRVPRRLKTKWLQVRAEAAGHAPSRPVVLRLRRRR